MDSSKEDYQRIRITQKSGLFGPLQIEHLNIFVMQGSRQLASQRYYQNHKDEIKERNKAWLMNDPSGEKKKKAMLSKLKSTYRHSPTIARALTIYAMMHDVEKERISIPVEEVKKEVDAVVFYIK